MKRIKQMGQSLHGRLQNVNIVGNNHHQSCNVEYQQQQQLFANNQTQKTAQTQRFIEAVDNAYTCVSSAALMYKRAKHSDKMVDILCDTAVVALNMFAACCESLWEENNQDAIDLGMNQAQKKFAELASQNTDVYELVEPHRKFMFAALHGQKNLRYNANRVDPASVELFENNLDDINDAFAKVIGSQQKFRARQESFKNPEINKALAQKHTETLAEIRKNKSKNKHKNNAKNNQKFVRPKQSELYFTEKGKNSQFRDLLTEKKQAEEKNSMDTELNGAEDSAYEKQRKKGKLNAIFMLSPEYYKKYNQTIINYPIPCKLEGAFAEDPENMIIIRMCKPYRGRSYKAHMKKLNWNEQEVIALEDQYIDEYGGLGYDSINKQQPDVDAEEFRDEIMKDFSNQ